MLCDFRKTFYPTKQEELEKLLQLKNLVKNCPIGCHNCVYFVPPKIDTPEYVGDYGNCSIHPELFYYYGKQCPYWIKDNTEQMLNDKIQQIYLNHKFNLGEIVRIKTKFEEDQLNWFDSKDYQGIAYIMGTTVTISGIEIYKNSFIYSVFENSYKWLEDMLEDNK